MDDLALAYRQPAALVPVGDVEVARQARHVRAAQQPQKPALAEGDGWSMSTPGTEALRGPSASRSPCV